LNILDAEFYTKPLRLISTLLFIVSVSIPYKISYQMEEFKLSSSSVKLLPWFLIW